MVAVVVLKGGAGSGFHGHKGRPGEVGGSVSEGSSATVSKRFIVPEEAWYLDPDRKSENRTREYVQAWADRTAARGWDVEKCIKDAWKQGCIPQAIERDYPLDWGLQADKSYTVWRTGNLDAKPGGTYFGPTKEEVSAYDSLHVGEDFKSYEVVLHNPAVYEDKNAAWMDLLPVSSATVAKKRREYENYHGWGTGDKMPMSPHHWAIENANYRNTAIETNRAIDARLCKALKIKGYDSMVLLNPELPCSREIMLIDPSKNLVNND